jgi:alkanesulfonate monooxygenase SsuD/methylene tetrahydromethanopterin reductase-like flavin-dependent oxidoreductase (luciferase family)
MLGHPAARTDKISLPASTTLITTNDPVKIAGDYAMLRHLALDLVDPRLGRGRPRRHFPGSARTSALASRS